MKAGFGTRPHIGGVMKRNRAYYFIVKTGSWERHKAAEVLLIALTVGMVLTIKKENGISSHNSF